MLELYIPGPEYFDEEYSIFLHTEGKTIELEHSLISISKWEAKWLKPYLAEERKTPEEYIDYIRCMTISKNVDDIWYERLTAENYKQIDEYIKAPMTASVVNDRRNSPHKVNPEITTSELIYYWMTAYNIPFSCERWHLNRLMTLIRICNVKSDNSSTKMSRREVLEQQRALNQARRAKRR